MKKFTNFKMCKFRVALIITLTNLLICSSLNAQYTTLLDFAGTTNGSRPSGDLISDGTFLYGVTAEGGINNLGTIFKIFPDGTGHTILFNFEGTSNGSMPLESLISDGTFLYGMTMWGGTNNNGTIFKIMPDGTSFTKLLDFTESIGGRMAKGSLISDGTFLYGMTYAGGTHDIGTIFKIMPDGTSFTKLLDFNGTTNGGFPYASLIYDGTFLYGMTSWGGTNNNGTIFKIMPDGTGYSKLVDFAGVTNGRSPRGSLFSDGTFLYGMTSAGGTNDLGTIFKIMSDGTGYSKLVDFAGTTNGSSPHGSLISDGIFLYGMTISGGTNNLGTIFKIMPNGSDYSKLFDFQFNTSGQSPYGSLFSDGTFLYGMTYLGGTNNMGTIFKYQYISTNVDENNAVAEYTIYPNPASEMVTININRRSNEELLLNIYDVTGVLIKSETFEQNQQQIHIADLSDGIYMVEIKSKEWNGKQKLIIQR